MIFAMLKKMLLLGLWSSPGQQQHLVTQLAFGLSLGSVRFAVLVPHPSPSQAQYFTGLGDAASRRRLRQLGVGRYLTFTQESL